MRSYFQKAAGLAVLALTVHVSGIAQLEGRDTLDKKFQKNEEVIIKPKTDKDVRLDVEIKDGQVTINGKSIEDFKDENVSVLKKKMMVMDGRNLAFRINGDDIGDLVANGFENNMLMGNEGRSFLGVISEKAEGAGEEGAKIKEVTKGSGAEKAGLKVGDLITGIDKTRVTNPEDFAKAIHEHKPGETVTVRFRRDGQEQKVDAVLGTAKGEFKYDYKFDLPYDLNLNVPPGLNIDPHVFVFGNDRPKLGIKARDTEDGKGVKVLGVDDDSQAAKAGIGEGDIITRFDGKEVNSATQLADLAKDLSDKTTVKIDLLHDGKPRQVEVKVPKKLKTADL